RSYNLPSYSWLLGGVGGKWSVGHVRRRVERTQGLHRHESRATAGAAAAGELPSRVLRLERLRRERDDLPGRRRGQDDVHPARPRARLEVVEQGVAVLGPRGGQRGWVDHHETGCDVREPAPE